MNEDVNSVERDIVLNLTATVDAPDEVTSSLCSSTQRSDEQLAREERCVADTRTLRTHYIGIANDSSSSVHQSVSPRSDFEENASRKIDPPYNKDIRVDGPTAIAGDKLSTQTRPRRETWRDWWILVCAFLFNVHTGFNFSTYAILYVPLTELFESSRAAVGWIQSIEIALACLLSK